MDKNFVEIDNLVRQRLGGGEQQEPNGAWHSMRELLDKEMPQAEPIGGLYWRRIFGGVAMLLLAGAVGVGGYKLATSSAGSDARNTDGAVATESAANVTSPSVGNSAKHAEAGDHSSVAGVADNGAIKHSIASTGLSKTLATDNNNSDRSDNNLSVPSSAENKLTSLNRKDNTQPGNSVSANGSHVGAGSNTTSTATKAALTSTTGSSIASDINDISGKSGKADKNKTSARAEKSGGHIGYAGKNTHSVNTSATGVDKMALGGHAASIKEGVAVNGHKIHNNSNVAAIVNNQGSASVATGNKNINAENATTQRTVPVFVTRSGNKIPGDRLQKLNTDKAKQNKIANTEAVLNTLKGKRVIQKMALVEHFIKTNAGGEGFYKLDTVSIVTLTEDLGIETETNNTPANAKKSENGK